MQCTYPPAYEYEYSVANKSSYHANDTRMAMSTNDAYDMIGQLRVKSKSWPYQPAIKLKACAGGGKGRYL